MRTTTPAIDTRPYFSRIRPSVRSLRTRKIRPGDEANSNQAGAPLLSSLYSESIQILPLGKLAPEIMMELAEISNPSEDIK